MRFKGGREPSLFRWRSGERQRGLRRLVDGKPVAVDDGAALDNLGIDAAIHVAETAHERRRDVEIAYPARRVDIGRGAALDALRHLQAQTRRSLELSVDEVELGPGGEPFDLEVAAKAQRIDRRADQLLDRGDACEV